MRVQASTTPILCAMLVLATPVAPAVAAKVYRCGNVFQDQPCASEKDADTRPAAKTAPPRDATPVATKAASPVAAPTPDRLVVEAARSVAIEARR